MKKTTYIIIATILVTAVASFFMSPMLFRKVSEDSNSMEKFLKGTGKTTTVRTEPFTAIIIHTSYEPYMLQTDGPLSVRIVESAEAQQSSVSFDTAWEGNMTHDVSDSTLNIDLTMTRTAAMPKDENSFNMPFITIHPDICHVATITVPKGTLTQVSADIFRIELKDFDNASLKLSTSAQGFQAEGCSFANLYIDTD